MNFDLTPASRKFVARMLRFAPTPTSGFRMVATTGGCSGLSIDFSVEEAPAPGDAVEETEGLRLFLPSESRVLLMGATIDFADSITGSGFVVHSPNASSCGCSSGVETSHSGPALFALSKL